MRKSLPVGLLSPLIFGLAAPATAQVDIRNGDPHDATLTWYTEIGLAVRDALREGSGKCYSPPGEIVICKKRSDNFRIDPNVLYASRAAHSGGGGDDYDDYRRARARGQNQ